MASLLASSEKSPAWANLAAVLADIEEGRGSAALKYQMASTVLTGKAFSRGAPPYQDFELLLDIRNSLSHPKFDSLKPAAGDAAAIQEPKLVTRLRSKNVTAEFEKPGTLANWIVQISTPALGRWACNAATAIVRAMISAIPESESRGLVEEYYKFGFQLIASDAV